MKKTCVELTNNSVLSISMGVQNEQDKNKKWRNRDENPKKPITPNKLCDGNMIHANKPPQE